MEDFRFHLLKFEFLSLIFNFFSAVQLGGTARAPFVAGVQGLLSEVSKRMEGHTGAEFG